MQRIDSLELPSELPADKVIKSCGQNIHDYEPEFWEFRYEIDRYLKNMSNDNLIKRYEDICLNFQVLTGKERNVIPINSFLSSWYWCRKEHQTRYEFFLRKLPLPVSPPQPRLHIEKPYRAKGPNSCDILFRYGYLEPTMKSLYEKGKTEIKPASGYKDSIAIDPRTDDEKNKHQWLIGDHTIIKTLDGKRIPIIGDVKRTVSTSDYYTLCLSCDFEPLIFQKFGYDSCVVIKNPTEFAQRLEQSSKDILPNWYFHHNPMEYFDPNEPVENQYFNATMCKDFSYAYQMEYRFIWDPLGNGKVAGNIELDLGPLTDICELYILK